MLPVHPLKDKRTSLGCTIEGFVTDTYTLVFGRCHPLGVAEPPFESIDSKYSVT